MIGVLADHEIAAVLVRNRLGYLGCCANDRPYVVPITYTYADGCVYAYSSPGRKLDVMREQPLVCFTVAEIAGPTAWRSVIGEGIYEELADEARQAALRRLVSAGGEPVGRGMEASGWIVVFRLRLTAISGRFERRDA